MVSHAMPHDSMRGMRHRLGTLFMIVGLLATVLYVADSFANAKSAEARCAGDGVLVRSTYSQAGAIRASELPIAGTCNSNTFYASVLTDEITDGQTVAVQVRNGETGGGSWVTEETTGTSMEWSFNDTNTTSDIRLCAGDFGCGFGAARNSSGENWGY